MLHHDDDHDRGLLHDLQTMNAQLVERRRALAFFMSAGTAALVSGCGGEDSSASASTTSTSTSSSGSSTTSGASTASTSTTSTSTGSCVTNATETNGPYPADGTNSSSGSTSNVLTVSGVVRSDIRSSFIGSTATAAGVLLTLTLRVVDAANSCAPVVGAAVYIWHCNATGLYSLYSSGATTESWLRGVQVTDANGEVTFTTIYPGCYEGRWPHIHFEVFRSGLASTSTGRTASLISQIAMPAAINTAVYATSGYSSSVSPYSRVTLASDNVFGDNSSTQLAQMTASLTGSTTAGYAGTVIVGI